MLLFELLVALLFGSVLLAALARRIGAPYPALLAVGGVLLALWPAGPRLTLDPGLALALFVAPVLLDAAHDASPRDLRANWAPLAALILVAVSLTALCVALVARALRPEMTLAVGLVLGAVVAPPDAAAATAVLHQVQPPHRILTILEGESLLNDAVALLIYRLAISAATVPGFSPLVALPLSLATIAGSLVVGYLLGRVLTRFMQRVTDPPSSIVIQFVTTFGVWMLAERMGLSGVLTIVAYAITVARNGSAQLPARLRIPSFAVWDTVVFVLNVLAFVLIGLQIRPILEHLSAAQRTRDVGFALAVLATVVVVRLAGVMSYSVVVRVQAARRHRTPTLRATLRSGLLISWCGMRGIVTLAAALALPAEFPQRDLIALTSFAVVLGTLLVQGLTLKPLVRLLDIRDDHPVEREIRAGWLRSLEAALGSLKDDASDEAAALRDEFSTALKTVSRESGPELEHPALPFDALRRRAVAAARDAVEGMRRDGEIGDDAFHTLQEELDRLELSADSG